MSSQLTFTLTPYDDKRLSNLCGNCNSNLNEIEKIYNVKIHCRGNFFQITGEHAAGVKAKKLIEVLYNEVDDTFTYDEKSLDVKKQMLDKDFSDNSLSSIKCRNQSQLEFIELVRKCTVTFAVGPAGTGKTYLAAATAVESLNKNFINKIILTRPVVEAGEHLGFLPGDLNQKVDPYLRPIFDSLNFLLGPTKLQSLMEQNVIEIAPLAYMRGRSLNNAFIILDEGQNTTIDQMKMFLTRIGFRSKAIITGDCSQIDIPSKVTSGLVDALSRLSGISDDIAIHHFSVKDVVRHPIVQTIVRAYEK